MDNLTIARVQGRTGVGCKRWFGRRWYGVLVASLLGLGCSAVDSGQLPPRPTLLDAGGGSSDRDAAMHAPDAGGRGSDGGQPDAGGPGAGEVPCEPVAEACNGKDDDCDGSVDETTDGACAAAQSSMLCVEGACVVVACTERYRDCDGLADNGCEVSIASSVAHCGGCRAACTLSQAETTVCGPGAGCEVGVCNDGFADCDGDDANGCETLLRTETNCGGCASLGDAMPCHGLPNTAASDCSTGACRVTCVGGFQDCDGDAANGCEQAGGAGSCGCEDPLADSDGDGTVDCDDGCDDDPLKTAPGACGCGTDDGDSDGDGIPDCVDLCDDDPLKTTPMQCGCGVAEGDRDGDGRADCNDGCPGDAATQDACFGFAHSNFDAAALDFDAGPMAGPVAVLDCGDVTIDSTDPDGGGPLVATIEGWCGPAPTPVAQPQRSGVGPELVVLPLRGLELGSGRSLRVVGQRPVVLAVRGDVRIDGSIDASAEGRVPGAGGNTECAPAPAAGGGEQGRGSPERWPGDPRSGASGGGGGGFGSAGGAGGRSDTDNNGCGNCSGGRGGATGGSANLIPLRGGCGGGRAGGCGTDGGGGGGGALQITASGSIVVTGALRAAGGAGATPCGGNDEGGGTGGGSGGAVLLEADGIDLGGAQIDLQGGRGGRNGAYAGIYNCGGRAGGGGGAQVGSAGASGGQCQAGGSGGGGGYGRLRVSAAGTCTGCP